MSFIENNFYKFICYDKEIYQIYNLHNNTVKNLITKNSSQEEKRKELKDKIKKSIQDNPFYSAFQEFSLDARNFLQSNQNKQSLNNNEVQTLISLLQKNNLYSEEELNQIINKFNNLKLENNKNIKNALIGQFSNASGKLTEEITNSSFNQNISNILNRVSKSFKTGDIKYGNDFGVLQNKYKNNTVIDFKSQQTINFYNGNDIKADLYLETTDKNNKISSFTFGIKSQWTNSKSQISKIQKTGKDLRNVISLYNFYASKNSYISRNVNSYWSYLNSLYYNEKDEDVKNITKMLIYGAYFGNVDFMIDYTIINDVIDIKIVTMEEIIEQMKIPIPKNTNYHFNFIKDFQNSSISENEDKILNGYKFSSMTLNFKNF